MRSIIRALLTSHEPADEREDGHLRSMRELLDTATAPFDRHHMRPGHFTVSAFVLSPALNSLLLVHHSKLRRWLQPGGHVETVDASPWETARREVAEETGLVDMEPAMSGDNDVPLFDLDVHNIPAHDGAAAHQHHDLRFLFVASSLGVIAGDGVEAARWVPLYEVPRTTPDESVLRAVRKIEAWTQKRGDADAPPTGAREAEG